jgi:hypothetical protein
MCYYICTILLTIDAMHQPSRTPFLLTLSVASAVALLVAVWPTPGQAGTPTVPTVAHQAWAHASAATRLEQAVKQYQRQTGRAPASVAELQQAGWHAQVLSAGPALAWQLATPPQGSRLRWQAAIASRELCLELNHTARIRLVDDRLRCQAAQSGAGYVLALTVKPTTDRAQATGSFSA